jgi:adenylate kinase
MIIILMGAQGSGKGTQGKLLSEKLGISTISMGNLLRKKGKEDTPLGKEIKEMTTKGVLVPDEITTKIIKERIEKEDCEKGYILDGFPRRVSQAKILDEFIKIDKVVEIKLSDEEAVKRISARRVCKQCGTNFNIIYIKPKQEGVCDKCGGELYRRVDDEPEAIKERLKLYREKTEPLKEYYKEKGKLLEINGEQPIKDVFNDIVKALGI